MTNRWRKTGVAIFIGFCILAALLSFDLLSNNQPSSSSSPELYRKLKAKASTPSIHSWATRHLKPLTEAPEPSKETVLFWSIPKSGTTTVKEIYKCLGQTVANKFGALPRFGHDQDEELIVFRPWKNKGPAYVNVDSSSKEGIIRAQELGLVPSGLADIIFTNNPKFAIEHLYDEQHKGRVMGLFRHPVDRLVSKFYYLRVADWEQTYHPEWNEVRILEFATKMNNESNHMVKQLVGKAWVTEKDLQIAMRTVKQRFVIGLMNNMEESIHRFNIVMGIDESDEENKKCMDQFFGHGVVKKNSNPHPKVEEGCPAWEALAEKNTLDIRLYEYMVQLFDEQKDIIESYAIDMAAQEK